jgi:hypothetical protein
MNVLREYREDENRKKEEDRIEVDNELRAKRIF